MKYETISDALHLLDDDLIAHADKIRKNPQRTQTIKKIAAFFAAAACLCLLCAAAAVAPLLRQKAPARERFYDFRTGNRLTNTGNGTAGSTDNETFVSVESLLVSDSIQRQALLVAFVPVEDYTALYIGIPANETLSASLGAAVPQTTQWYYVSGHRDMQYLIQNIDGACTLWEFQCFTGDSYPYADVLHLIYRLESPDDIVSVQVSPPNMINSDAGKKLQEEIGTRSITDRSEIEAVYRILSSLTCYGGDRWDLIDYGNAEASTDSSGSLDAIELGRYLSLVTACGNEIDSLKYTAVSNMFYEYGGIAYNILSEEHGKEMREILGITSE